MFEAIKRNGGVVGAIFDTNMIGRAKTTGSLVDHIISIHDRFGPEVLAIGTDYFGLPGGNAAEGLEDIGRIGGLFEALRARGISEPDIQKIASGNALRVVKANSARWR